MVLATEGTTTLQETARRFFCHCVMQDDTEIYLVVRANDFAEASHSAHNGYTVAYVLDVLTPIQMEVERRLRRPMASYLMINPLLY